MISVIVHGRNDAHGYNLHRRVALSLNCIAEVLTDADDEIVFVDYNTPDQLPTLVEALADTLTQRCLALLRVLRVPAHVHLQRFAERTHLPIVEPVARNVGARRASPSNRWLLSTTTDMIFVPLIEPGLSETCADLADGFYGLPRFELPEWVWEHLPRTDPQAALTEIGRLGQALRLDEATVSHPEIRFDAPGDFQLVLREDFFAVDGFDEEMVLGWHVDSNLSKRLLIHRGSIESLENAVAGYHCNHQRTPTVYHGTDVANDLSRFFHALDRVDVPAQRETWGLVDEELEEVNPQHGSITFASAVLATVAGAASAPGSFDARETKYAVEYDSHHVLPFVADALSVSASGSRVAYIGANPVLERLLEELVGRLDVDGTLATVELDDQTSISRLARNADLFVVDLGVDSSLFDAPSSASDSPGFAQLRSGLIRTFDAFRHVVELERRRIASGLHPRRFVLVNSTAVYWNAYVLAHLHSSSTTPHSRTRHAIVRTVRDEGAAAKAAETRALRLVRWTARRDSGRRALKVRLGETIEISELDDYPGFGDGWAFPEPTGVWTQGLRSELSLELDAYDGPRVLTFGFDEIGVPRESPVNVHLVANGVLIAARDFHAGLLGHDGQQRGSIRRAARRLLRPPLAWAVRRARAWGVPGVDAAVARARRLLAKHAGDPFVWRVILPADSTAAGKVDLAIVVQEPVAWDDQRRRGLHLRSLAVEDVVRHRRPDLRWALPVWRLGDG